MLPRSIHHCTLCLRIDGNWTNKYCNSGTHAYAVANGITNACANTHTYTYTN